MEFESNTFVEQAVGEFVQRLGERRAVWQNDVRAIGSMPMVVNDDRDVPLSGGNALVLVQKMWDEGWLDPRWMTEEQVHSRGAVVKEGQAATEVQFVRAIGTDGGIVDQPMVVTYALFNAGQVDGLEPWTGKGGEHSLELLAERLLPSFDVNIVHDQVDQAFWSASDGNVHMPPPSAFASLGEYVGVAVHELSHASRGELGREVDGDAGQPSFAKEELRAELASMQLSIAMGIPHDTKRHEGFTQEWVDILNEDPGELFRAARDASMMAALVLWHVKAVERELVAEKQVSQVTVTYSVQAVHNFDSQDFDSAERAAEAFHGIDANDRPQVVRVEHGAGISPGGRASVIATTAGQGKFGEAVQYGKYAVGHDPEFDAAYAALVARETQHETVNNEKGADAPGEAQMGKDFGAMSIEERRRAKYKERIAEAFANRQAVLAIPNDERERELAKKAGALFYGEQKVWFVPQGLDVALFKRWSVREGQGAVGHVPSRDEIIAEFEKAMKSLGLSTSLRNVDKGSIDDGKWHYVSVPGHKSGKNAAGAVILNVTGGRDGRPRGYIENKLTGESLSWTMECPGLTPEQVARMRAEAIAREEAAAKEIAERQEAVALEAQEIWDAAEVVPHGYFKLKGVEGHGCRVVDGATLLKYTAFKSETGGSIIRAGEKYALVPMVDEDGKLWALQAISEDGKAKAFMTGGRKKGLFCVIGEEGVGSPLPASGRLAFAEGFATGASLHEGVDGLPVVVCFDAGNLEAVAREAGKRLPAAVEKVVGADNDQFFMERAFGALAKIGVVAHGDGPSVKVISGPGESREVPLGQVVADGEWHQATGGRYCVKLEQDKWVPECVGKVRVEFVANDAPDGHKETLIAGNRGLDAARIAVEEMGGKVVIPGFAGAGGLRGRPTDWNDLAVRGGDVGAQVWAQLGGVVQEVARGAERRVVGGRGR